MPPFPVIPTPAGPQHTFRDLAPQVAPPFRWELQVADVQEFDPAALEAQRHAQPEPVLDLFSLMK